MDGSRFDSLFKWLIFILIWIPFLISCQGTETNDQSKSSPKPKGFTILNATANSTSKFAQWQIDGVKDWIFTAS